MRIREVHCPEGGLDGEHGWRRPGVLWIAPSPFEPADAPNVGYSTLPAPASGYPALQHRAGWCISTSRRSRELFWQSQALWGDGGASARTAALEATDSLTTGLLLLPGRRGDAPFASTGTWR